MGPTACKACMPCRTVAASMHYDILVSFTSLIIGETILKIRSNPAEMHGPDTHASQSFPSTASD